jgi:2-oxoglutarate/2-oxoacid ferredoxin oxidoreductase subunit alpha
MFYSIIVGGAAGEGSKKTGAVVASILHSYGYYVFIHEDYESLIKGGHNFSLVRFGDEPVEAISEKIDFLLALNQDTVNRHQAQEIIFNSEQVKDVKGIGLPIEQITQEMGGIPIMKNVALIGALAKRLGIPWSTVKKVIEKEMPKKTEINVLITKKGYDSVENKYSLKKLNKKKTELVTGNEAIARGAVAAGLDAYVAYPMTPATSILHYLAKVKKTIVFQPENEIAVINSALGMAYTGKKTMVGTSGGGFALMTEGISLSAQAEIPMVIVDSQRMGPATGVPTYGGQADLFFALGSGHGDFQRLVITPSNAEDAFSLTAWALEMSWKYQLPAIILTDKDLAESTYEASFPKIKAFKVKTSKKKNYLRYEDTDDGISPLAFPGDQVVKATSYEHDEKGIAVEDAESIFKMQEKRYRKEKALEKELEKIKTINVYGQSKKAVIAWGSTVGAVKEAAKALNLTVIQPTVLQPFPNKEMSQILNKMDKVVSVEQNISGQLGSMLGIPSLCKYNGRPFTVEELIKELKKI